MSDPWYKDGLHFRCTRCGNCCTGKPGFVWLSKKEVTSLANFKEESEENFLAFYARKIGSRLSLREKTNGDCIFFDRLQGCLVYSVRPIQCQTWPFWQSNLERRESWEKTCEICPGSGQGDLIPLEEISKRLKAIRL
ncbi:MAG: YkgJ family cysteine cluster protein [Gemmataceae bacterium]